MEASADTRQITITTPSDTEIRSERFFAAPRELVFRAHVEAELITKWWGMGETVVEQFDPVVGGAWRFVQHDEEHGSFAFFGEYREVSPHDRLAYTFEWEGMPGHVVIDELTFEDVDGGTRLVGISRFATREDRDGMIASGMERGMDVSFRRLDALLEQLLDA